MDKEKELAALKEQLAKAEEEKATVIAEKAALEAKMQSGDTRLPIPGAYKGYRFDDGHRRVRDRSGNLCDSAELLAAASGKTPDAKAVETLEWLIEINYAHFKKGKA